MTSMGLRLSSTARSSPACGEQPREIEQTNDALGSLFFFGIRRCTFHVATRGTNDGSVIAAVEDLSAHLQILCINLYHATVKLNNQQQLTGTDMHAILFSF